MEGKTIVFDGGGSDNSTTNALLAQIAGKSGIDPSMLAMMGQNGGGFGGQNGMFMMLFLLLLLGRNGLNGLGGGGELNTVANNELLMNAINGNRDAVRDLAGLTNTSITAVNGALAGLNTQLATLGGTIGMSTQQVINAIQMGNSTVASQLAACCCDIKTTVNEQGFQNRFAELQQTNQLTATMNANHSATMERFTNLELNALRDKNDALRERNTQLVGEISQRNQNEFIYAQTRGIYDRLGAIECRQLPTYPQQYVPGFPVTQFAAPIAPFGGGGNCGNPCGGHF